MPLRIRIAALVFVASWVLSAPVIAIVSVAGAGDPIRWGLATASCLSAALMFLVCRYVRRVLRPLERAERLLCALAQGDLHAAPTDNDLRLPDEAGRVLRGVALVRQEFLALHALREERHHQLQSRESILRQQLRLMADRLDDVARADVLQALDADDPDADGEFTGLAPLLGRIAGLLTSQQDRLVGLLNELRQAMDHQAALAGLRQELEIARTMQQSILPRRLPAMRGIDVTALMVPAREVGGDFYDYFMIDDDHFAVVIADVSGKGIPAAFFMAISRTLLKSNALFLREPAQVATRLNEQLCAENEQLMFVTAFVAVLDMRQGTLDFVNAGHNPPVLRDRRGGVSLLPRGQNPALAVVRGHPYAQGRIQLRAGDTLLLYTDGMTEANDPSGSLFGEDRLLDAVALHDPACEDLPQALLRRVRAFEAGSAQADDITCVALRYERPQSPGGVPVADLPSY